MPEEGCNKKKGKVKSIVEKRGHISHASNQNYMQPIKLLGSKSVSDRRKYFFTGHLIALWNWLPQNIVEAMCINGFKKVIIQINERKVCQDLLNMMKWFPSSGTP